MALIDEVPIYQSANGSLVGYGGQCVKSISVGIDNSIWAISCDLYTNSSTNYKIIKWDFYLSRWYVVPDRSGV